MDTLIYYAQNKEDVILSAFFPDMKKGFYVDVGAHHPTDDSVTKFFYEKGWRGVNIEPQQHLFKLLKRSRKGDTNLRIGISNEPGELSLRSYESDGLSTFSKEVKKEYSKKPRENTQKYRDQKVQVDTLKNVFSKHNVSSVQFMKVDVEGFEYEVLEGNDWSKYRPEVLCIEASHIVKDWRPLFKKHQYEFVFFDGLNEYYVAKEANHRKQLFNKTYPEILVSKPQLSYGWSKHITKVHKQLERVQSALDKRIEQNAHLQEQLAKTQEEVNQFRSTKFLAKELVRRIKRKLFR